MLRLQRIVSLFVRHQVFCPVCIKCSSYTSTTPSKSRFQKENDVNFDSRYDADERDKQAPLFSYSDLRPGQRAKLARDRKHSSRAAAKAFNLEEFEDFDDESYPTVSDNVEDRVWRAESPLVGNEEQTTILIRTSDFGKIIGQGGQTIMEIERRTGCRLIKNSPKPRYPTEEDNYRKLTLMGRPAKIHFCMQLLKEELGYDNIKEAFVYKLPMHLTQQLLGRVGEKLRSIEDETGVTILTEKDESFGFLNLEIQGYLHQIEHAVSIIRRKTGVVRTRDEVEKDKILSIPASKVIHIRNLEPAVTEKQLLAATKQFGSVQAIVIAPSGTQALIEFKNVEDAEDCISWNEDSTIMVNEKKLPVSYSDKATLTRRTRLKNPADSRSVF